MKEKDENRLTAEERKKLEQEKKAKDREKRRISRVNARVFERVNPLLVQEGLEGKFVLIDNARVWGISSSKRTLNQYYQQLHTEGKLKEGFPLTYQISAKDAEAYLAREHETGKSKQRRTIKKTAETQSERKYSHPGTAKRPKTDRPYQAERRTPSQTPDDNTPKTAENDNRNIYIGKSLQSSNNISSKMADKKPDKQPEKKEGKKPEQKQSLKERVLPSPKSCEEAITEFRKSYEDYQAAVPCYQAAMNHGDLHSNPITYGNLETKISEFVEKEKMSADLFPRERNADGTPGKYHNHTLGRTAKYWYNTSKGKVGKTVDSNLEKIAFGLGDDAIRTFVEKARAPSTYSDKVKDLAESHKKYSELNDLFVVVEHAEDAGEKQAALSKIYDAGFKIFEDKMEKNKVDPELRSIFRDIFGYSQAVKMAKSERDARYKVFKEQLGKTKKPELADYFAGIAKDMTGKEETREVLYNALYGLTMPPKKK